MSRYGRIDSNVPAFLVFGAGEGNGMGRKRELFEEELDTTTSRLLTILRVLIFIIVIEAKIQASFEGVLFQIVPGTLFPLVEPMALKINALA